MYHVELEIKDITGNITFASYPDLLLLLWSYGQLHAFTTTR